MLQQSAIEDDTFDISKSLNIDDIDSASASDLDRPEDTKGITLDENVNDDDDRDFIAATQAASNRKASNIKGRSVQKGGGFQAMGLSLLLLKAIAKKGFNVPTPIQRKSIPPILEGRDVVGMARTGSGKTAAFVIPMIERLRNHSARFGARALILSPSRELALQTLKVTKELSRGSDLRSVLLVGGDNLEDQFGLVSSNPDIIIATPGRFLHLQVEMSLDLSSIEYIVFDEADRLFEMGFAAQLTEILHSLPVSRQTLLFSATLPKSLVEFARAGLQDPSLVRLDAESKISSNLESAFFTVQSAEKEGALLHLLTDIIKIPLGAPEGSTGPKKERAKKRKRDEQLSTSKDSPTPHSTLIFASTKHHVEYLATLLKNAGFAVSYVYGSLDQTARKIQVQDFRSGNTNILVVTDVAARGIDIPILANVVNYDFPPQAKIFVHRVGRTARANKAGWSYSLICDSDAPYLLDLQLFLGKPLLIGRQEGTDLSFSQNLVVGSFSKDKQADSIEWATKLLDEDNDLVGLQSVSLKAEKQYNRTKTSASHQSAKRAKNLISSDDWRTVNALFSSGEQDNAMLRNDMLLRVGRFRPQETVFEMGRHGNLGLAAQIIKKRREKMNSKAAASDMDNKPDHSVSLTNQEAGEAEAQASSSSEEEEYQTELLGTGSEDDEGKTNLSKTGQGRTWEDSQHFMKYTPSSVNIEEEHQYSVGATSKSHQSDRTGFVQAARGVTMDLGMDQDSKSFGESSRAKGMRWDKKSRKYVARANDEDGSKGSRMIVGESGQKISASFKSGRFDDWRRSNRVSRLPRVGEAESNSTQSGQNNGRAFKHKAERAPKAADRFRDDYHKQRKRVEEAKTKRVGEWQDGQGQKELRSIDAIQKQRKLKNRRQEKNARPSKRKRT